MFHTLTGSLVILLAMVGIICVLALFLTALLRWMFLTDVERAETTTIDEPSTPHGYRRAA